MLVPSARGGGEGSALNVASWVDMELLLGRALRQTSAHVNERSVLLAESAFPSLADRERFAQLLFETFDVAGERVSACVCVRVCVYVRKWLTTHADDDDDDDLCAPKQVCAACRSRC